jgi:hypothetical protein
MLDDCRQPVGVAATLFCLGAAGQVAHRGDHQRAVLGVGMGQGDLYGKRGAVPSPSARLQIKSHGPCEGGRKIARPVHRVGRTGDSW